MGIPDLRFLGIIYNDQLDEHQQIIFGLQRNSSSESFPFALNQGSDKI